MDLDGGERKQMLVLIESLSLNSVTDGSGQNTAE